MGVVYILSGGCNKELVTVVTGSEQKRREDVDSQVNPKGYSLRLLTRAFADD